MSNEALTAVRLYSNALGPQRMVLTWIADAIRNDTGEARISREYLADACLIDINNLSTYIQKLKKSGDLILRPIGRKNVYIIPILPGEPGYDPVACTAGDAHKCNGYHTPLEVMRGQKKYRVESNGHVAESQLVVESRSVAEPRLVAKSRESNREITTNIVAKSRESNREITTPTMGVPNIPISPHIYPIYNPNAHAREESTHPNGNLAIADAEPEAAHSPPAPPLPVPDVAESRALWHDVRQRCVIVLGAPAVDAWGSGCHLYKLGEAYYQLRLGRGIDEGMFRRRFESVIGDSISALTRQGNNIVEIVRSA